MENFADKILGEIERKQNPSVVGLDPVLEHIPGFIREEQINMFGRNFKAVGGSIFEFNKRIIDAVQSIVPAVKPQVAFYEQYGHSGIKAYEATCRYARDKGLIVICDAKRGDIGHTAEAYANCYLGRVDLFGMKVSSIDADAVTVNPYIGSDTITPFVRYARHGKGIFVLVKTSNKSSSEVQDLRSGSTKIYEMIAALVNRWGEGMQGERGYNPVGAVVGATYPREAGTLRKLMPSSIFLVPGYGAQGGSADDVAPCFNRDGYGSIVNSSRGIIFAYEKGKCKEQDFDRAAAEAAEQMRNEIISSLKKEGRCAW